MQSIYNFFKYGLGCNYENEEFQNFQLTCDKIWRWAGVHVFSHKCLVPVHCLFPQTNIERQLCHLRTSLEQTFQNLRKLWIFTHWFAYFSAKINVVVTQKNRFNKSVLLDMLRLTDTKIITINPLYTGNPYAGTLANSEEPNAMQHDAALHQGLHWLLGIKQNSGKNTAWFRQFYMYTL